jgi:hypothetical protein
MTREGITVQHGATQFLHTVLEYTNPERKNITSHDSTY